MKRRIILFVLGFSALSWALLEPWRPIFSGDDWAFYESVMLSIAKHKVIVSDWLEPSAVGLTIPAALMTLATGNFWTGSMLAAGLLGMVGVFSITRILRHLDLPDTTIAAATLALVFFPIFFEKWARFESVVPAMSLSLASIAALIAHVKRSKPDQFHYLLVAAICVTWAILIRQNHLALLAIGGMFLYVNSPSRRLVALSIWIIPSLVAAALYFSFVEPGFAARVTMRVKVVSSLSHLTFFDSFLTMMFFSFACSFGILLLADPSRTLLRLRSYSRRMFSAAVTTVCLMLLMILLRNKPITGLAPVTNIRHLMLVWPYPLAVFVLFGCIVWPTFLPRDWRAMFDNFPGVLLTLALLYLGGSSIRGGVWEYYALEPIVLLVLFAFGSWPYLDQKTAVLVNPSKRVGILLFGLGIICWSMSLLADWLLGKPFNVGSQQVAAMILGSILLIVAILIVQRRVAALAPIWKVLSPAVLAVYVVTSWYIERVEVDSQVNSLQIVEQSFRNHIATPGNVNAPFGLIAWNALQLQIGRWQTNQTGHPLAVWDYWNPKPAAQLRIYESEVPALRPGESILQSGTAMVGFEKRKWVLVKANGTEPPIVALPHRQLPLTSDEWDDWLRKHSD